MPDGSVLSAGPGKRRKVSSETLKHHGIGLEGINSACSADEPSSEIRVISNVSTDVEKSVTRTEKRS